MSPMRTGIVAITAVAAVALSGCGSDKDLSIPLSVANYNVAKYCAAGGPEGARAVKQFTKLLRDNDNPKTKAAVDGPKRTLKEWATDAANELEGCGDSGANYARQLDRVLANG